MRVERVGRRLPSEGIQLASEARYEHVNQGASSSMIRIGWKTRGCVQGDLIIYIILVLITCQEMQSLIQTLLVIIRCAINS